MGQGEFSTRPVFASPLLIPASSSSCLVNHLLLRQAWCHELPLPFWESFGIGRLVPTFRRLFVNTGGCTKERHCAQLEVDTRPGCWR
jgi:hypothetical protein